MEEDKKNEKTIKPEPASGAKFFVMPEEFRKTASKKKINKKILIIGATGMAALLAITITVVVFSSKPATLVSEETTKTTETTAATTTETTETTSTTTTTSLFTPAVTTTPEMTAPVTTVSAEELTQGTDPDADGLSDKEEALFQTDTKRPDSDGDGFLDGNEVFHLYNPSGVAPVGLLESGLVRLYRNASWGYQIYYPTLWSASSTTDGSMVAYLPSPGSESIIITVKNTDANTTLRSWYLSQYPTADINLLQSYTSKGGYQGLQDSNRLNTYIKQGSKVFIVTYDLGKDNTTVWYRRLYDMMLNSLKID